MPTLPAAKPSPLAGPLFMLLSACIFTAMNVLLKQAMSDFRIWDIGFYRFFGGLVLLTAIFGRRGNPFRSSNTKLTSEVLLTALAGIFLFGDPVSWRFAAGGTLILGSTVMIQLERAIRWGRHSPEIETGKQI